jgi:hypothetical protein
MKEVRGILGVKRKTLPTLIPEDEQELEKELVKSNRRVKMS